MDLKSRIKKLCYDKGISLNQLEAELNFGKGYLSKLGKSKPNSDKLQQIADYLGVTLDYLMTGKDRKMEFSSNQAELDLKISQDLELKSALEKYYSLSDKKKKHVLELIELLAGEE